MVIFQPIVALVSRMYAFVHVLADLTNWIFTRFWNPKPTCWSNFIIVSPNKVKLYNLLQNRVNNVHFYWIGSFTVLGFNFLYNMKFFMDDEWFSENGRNSKSSSCFSSWPLIASVCLLQCSLIAFVYFQNVFLISK